MSLMIPAGDPHIHVFSVAQDGTLDLAHQTFLSRLKEPADTTPLAAAFGAPIDTTYVEVFAIADIAPMTLREYLVQAHDVPPAALEQVSNRLDALRGDVVVLAPKAMPAGGTLAPHADLTLVGSFAPPDVNSKPVKLPPAAKEPSVADPADPSGAPIGRTLIGGIVLAALVLIGLILVLI
ncbi:MAG: hypothetical protein AAFQ50_07155 [Pseudomonadota bacterium]